MGSERKSAPTVHKLDASLALGERLVFVNLDRREEKIKENDLQKLIKSAIDDHRPVTDDQMNASVKLAFETGLFTVSEIIFDKGHTHALVSYSFTCGELCGQGNLLLLTKVGQIWKVSKTCGGWVS
jgi:hypothetical protein